MKSIRNNRRILGAILLTIVCFVASAAPAAACDRGSCFDERTDSLFSRTVLQIQSGVSNLFDKLGVFWNAAGASIED